MFLAISELGSATGFNQEANAQAAPAALTWRTSLYMCCLLILCLQIVSDSNACVFLLGKHQMGVDGVLIFLVCFRRSLVPAGTLLTVLDYLDGRGQVRASCLCHQAQG